MKYNIFIREAKTMDSKFLFNLKNDKDVRKWSIASKDKIKWDKHLKWLDKHLEEISIIYFNGERAGDIRFEEDEIAIKVNKRFRGNGLANYTIGIAKVSCDNIVAKIVDGNVPSMRLFIKNDFKVVDHKVSNGVGYYILKYEK